MPSPLHDLRRDLQHAARTLRHSPGFTAVAVLTLAIGIGMNAAVFTITNATLFKGFPLVERNDRLVYLTTGRGCCVSYPDFEDWRAQATSFEDMAIVHGLGITLADGNGFPENYTVTEISANTFGLVGQKPILGRDFTAADDTPGAPPVVILRYGFWERRFGKDPGIIGRSVRLNGTPTTVVGIMPQGFSFPQNQDLWVPLIPTPDVRRRDNHNTWFAFGRMKDGVTLDGVRAEMATIGRRLERAYPVTNKGFPPIIYTFTDFFIGANATLIYRAMWGAVGFVLLIACANLANLLLGQAVSRTREFCLRMALGAGRWRIVRQLLIESVMLSALGGLLGWWLATWGVRAYALIVTGSGISDAIAGGNWFDDILDYSMDYRVFAYLIAISVGTGLLFGLAPARRLTTFNVNAALKGGGRTVAGGEGGRRLSTLLVIGQMALAVVLLAGAGVMIRSFVNVYRAELGFNTDNIVVGFVSLPRSQYATTESQIAFFDRFTDRLQTTAGVESVSLASAPPGRSAGAARYELADAPIADPQRRPLAARLFIDVAYFRTIDRPVVAGRAFTDADGGTGFPAAIVNERFAREHWPGESAVGRRLRIFEANVPTPWLTIVGVVPNIVQSTRQETDPIIYVPRRLQPAENAWLIARTSIAPASLVTALRRAVQTLDAELPISIVPLTDTFASTYRYRAFTAGLFLMFAIIALLLASLGLYAVIAHGVSQRTQEIGIRIAIGASAREILGLIFRQGMLPLGIGLVAGLAASLALTPVLRASLVRVSPVDPITLALSTIVLVAAALLGCLIPARRAMRVDPIVALRPE